MRVQIILLMGALLASVAWGQQPSSNNGASSNGQSMPGMEMPAHDMSKMKDMPAAADINKDNNKEKENESDAGAHVMQSMEGHMDMGPHMKMTPLRQPQPGDKERAQQVADAARKASEKYLRRRCITSPTIPTLSKTRCISILTIRLRCFTKNMARTTS
jgi:hypothetical protein